MMTKKEKASHVLEILKKLYPNPKCELSFDPKKPYQLLFSVIMSAQTTDIQVNKLTQKLYVKYPTLRDFVYADLLQFTSDISSIGLYRNKAKNILATAKILYEKYDGEVPKTMEDIQSLPGAARKTANVVLFELYGINEGIAVDTHAARLSQLLGFTKHSDPKKIEQDLMKLLAREEWGNFSHRLILYGRYFWPAHKLVHDGELAQFADEKAVKKLMKAKLKKPIKKK
jgi:endonuclease III